MEDEAISVYSALFAQSEGQILLGLVPDSRPEKNVYRPVRQKIGFHQHSRDIAEEIAEDVLGYTPEMELATVAESFPKYDSEGPKRHFIELIYEADNVVLDDLPPNTKYREFLELEWLQGLDHDDEIVPHDFLEYIEKQYPSLTSP